MTRSIIAVFLVGVIVLPVSAAAVREVADEDVDRAIAEVKRYLWARQQSNGCWRGSQYVPKGGNTAIALLALLEAGESHNRAEMKKGLDALAALKTKNLYVIAVRTMVLSQVAAGSKESPYRACLEKDLAWLTQSALRAGAWGYSGPERSGDNSCSQFALLALWEADRAGLKINPALIRMVERTWLKRQRRDGGWTYSGQSGVDTESTATMTTAGIASLFICQDVLTNTCRPYPHSKALAAAWSFLAGRLKDNYIKNGYLAFCVQRIGMAGGTKFIGKMDWFATGAAKLAEPDPRGRRFRGQWGPIVRASFELIFLARGRIPLTLNKLAHGRSEDWNFHTRDVPHFTEFMRRNFEHRMRWQVVRVTDDVRELLDGPILLITGVRALDFTPEQWAKLREYSLRGGTLLFVPTHNSSAFLKSAREALENLYAEQRQMAGDHYRLEALPADHPLYSVHHKIRNGPAMATMWGVSDGTRLPAVICKRDICCAWQRRAVATGRLDYMLGVNFFLYATGANSLRMRLRPVFIARRGEVRRRAKIAWLAHGGNWPAQPYALKYLSAKLIAENRIALDVSVGTPVRADKLEGHDLAWMTGSSAFTLTDAELSALRTYLDSGGTLFINAVGGARAFNRSAVDMLDKLFAAGDVAVGYVTPGSPLMTGKCGEFRGPPLKSPLPRTRAWRKVYPRPAAPLRLFMRGGRAVVIYAPHGIHDTLDGHTAHGAMSYMPTAARDIAANVVLYSLMKKPTRNLPPGATTTSHTDR